MVIVTRVSISFPISEREVGVSFLIQVLHLSHFSLCHEHQPTEAKSGSSTPCLTSTPITLAQWWMEK